MSSSYSDDTVLSKLSSLNDTQDAIVTVSQWIMFHRRHAKRSVELWQERLKESAAHRKLNLIYLANEVVQQSKARNRPEFSSVFTPIIAESTEAAYKGTAPDIQNKIKRVVQVWRERSIFKPEIQQDIEQRLEAVDKGKSSIGSKAGGLKLGGGFLGGGGGGGGSNVPLDFVPLLKTHKELADKVSSTTIAVGSANTDFAKQFDTENLPAPPVYAARLSALIKTLDTANTAINGAITTREAHIRNIEKLLQQSRTALENDKKTRREIESKREQTEKTKNEVEALILEDMEKTGDDPVTTQNHEHSTTPDMKSPEVEALTPPHQVQFEPEAPPSASEQHHQHSTAPGFMPQPPSEFNQATSELLASLQAPLNGGGLKRSQAEADNMFEGLDEDLVNMFKNEAKRVKTDPMPMDTEDEYHP